jgi:chromosome segregation ATPase
VRTVRLLAILVFVSGLSGAAALAQQDQTQSPTGDPVADAARKAREQKKSAPKAKKVFTDDDVATKPVATETRSSSSTATDPAGATPPVAEPGSQDATSTKDGDSKEEPNSEAYWRKRFAAQRRKIAVAEEELNVLQREAEKADVQYYSDPQKALNEQLTRNEINGKNEKIAAKKKEIADLKQQFSDMEDEVRRTGGDPGWAR